jgi:hypothetical protein
MFEDYHWTLRDVYGFALVLFGNYIVLSRARTRATVCWADFVWVAARLGLTSAGNVDKTAGGVRGGVGQQP